MTCKNETISWQGQFVALDTVFYQRIAEIVGDVEIDMDAPLASDDE